MDLSRMLIYIYHYRRSTLRFRSCLRMQQICYLSSSSSYPKSLDNLLPHSSLKTAFKLELERKLVWVAERREPLVKMAQI
jgi:hypothetical protein